MLWYTLADSFDADFGVDEWHGHSTFLRAGECVYRTYFINVRGDEARGTTWSCPDMTALGILLRCQLPLVGVLMQAAFDVFVQNAGDQGLVGDALGQGPLLQSAKIL